MGHPLALWADVAFCPFGQFSSFWMEVAASGMDNILVLSLGGGNREGGGQQAGRMKARALYCSPERHVSGAGRKDTGEGNQQAKNCELITIWKCHWILLISVLSIHSQASLPWGVSETTVVA